MKSAWKVTHNPMGGYRAYRIRDTAQVDHSGNREHYGGYMDSREECQTVVDRLNNGEIVPDESEIGY